MLTGPPPRSVNPCDVVSFALRPSAASFVHHTLGAHATPAEHEVRYGVVAQLLADALRAMDPRVPAAAEETEGVVIPL